MLRLFSKKKEKYNVVKICGGAYKWCFLGILANGANIKMTYDSEIDGQSSREWKFVLFAKQISEIWDYLLN